MTRAIRDAYGEALVKYGRDNPDVVVLDADVSSSTKSRLFQEACPERFYNVGIAEANMTAMAAGFAAVGKIPFVNTFAAFISSLGLIAARSFASYSGLGIKLIGAYGGLSDSFDGPSHHSIDDIAIMRLLPNLKVYVASDEVQTDWLVRQAIEDRSPVYIRLSRDAMPAIYQPSADFSEGKGQIIRQGSDITIIACGLMVSQALAAARMLSDQGIDAAVIDMFCVKPLDKALILKSAAQSSAMITAEEHSVIGGLGSAVAETLCEAGLQIPVGFVGLADCHAECGPYEKLLQKYGLDAQAIVTKAHQLIDT